MCTLYNDNKSIFHLKTSYLNTRLPNDEIIK